MKQSTSDMEVTDDAPPAKQGPQGSQTLLRGLDMLNHVIDGPVPLAELSGRMGLTRSTTHRLANALIDRGFLTFLPREGYQLGPKLLHLGFLAQAQVDLVQIGRPHLEALANLTGDTVHLGRLDGDRVLYLDKIAGRRRIEISSRIGDHLPITSSALGKALLFDAAPDQWRRTFEAEQGETPEKWTIWDERMRGYVQAGCAFDLEENEDHVRCVSAPIRDASGGIVAAVSVTSVAQYMDDERMGAVGGEVRAAAEAIGSDLGWHKDGDAAPQRRGTRS